MTYLEIGPDTRIRTAAIADADGVEYAEVSHTIQPQNSVFKTNVGESLTIARHEKPKGTMIIILLMTHRSVSELGYFIDSSPP